MIEGLFLYLIAIVGAMALFSFLSAHITELEQDNARLRENQVDEDTLWAFVDYLEGHHDYINKGLATGSGPDYHELNERVSRKEIKEAIKRYLEGK